MAHDKIWPISAAADRIRKRSEARNIGLAERRRRAQEWAARIATRIGHSDHAIKLIFGFGSTFELWRNYRNDSDVDLAMIGGDWSKSMSRLPPGSFEVSLIELELQNEEFASYVKQHGRILYERE